LKWLVTLTTVLRYRAACDIESSLSLTSQKKGRFPGSKPVAEKCNSQLLLSPGKYSRGVAWSVQ